MEQEQGFALRRRRGENELFDLADRPKSDNGWRNVETPLTEVASARNDPLARPIAVVELLQEFELPGKARLTVIGVDLWTTWFEMRWHLTSDTDLYDELTEYWWDVTGPGRWWAEGDNGQRYDCLMGAGGGGNGKWSANVQFAPGLDRTTRTLILHIPIPPNSKVSQIHVAMPAS